MDELRTPVRRDRDSQPSQGGEYTKFAPPPNEVMILQSQLAAEEKVDVFAVWHEEDCEAQNCPVKCSVAKGTGICNGQFVMPIILTLVYFFIGMYFNCIMQVVAEGRSTRFTTIPIKYNMTKEDTDYVNTLPDLGYDILPFLPEKNLPDIWVFSIVGLGVLRFACTRLRLTILRRWTFLLGTIFFFRGVSIIMTMLPNPLHRCTTSIGDSSPFVEAFYVMFFVRITCSDVLFSGHTVFLTMMGLLFYDYSHVAPVAELDPIAPFTCGIPLLSRHGELLRCTTAKIIVWMLIVTGYLIIISTHFHYTVDVYLGSTLTVFIWRWYHEYIRTLHQRKFIMNDLFMFLERASPDIRLIHERSRQQQAVWENELNKYGETAHVIPYVRPSDAKEEHV